MSGTEIARQFRIPLRRKFGSPKGAKFDYILDDVHQDGSRARNRVKALKSMGWLAKVFQFTRKRSAGFIRGERVRYVKFPYYAVYYRPKGGWR